MNVLNKQKQEEILTLIIAGRSFREIAKRLHVSRFTVSEYAKAHSVIAKKGRTGGVEPKSLPFSGPPEAEPSSSGSLEVCSVESSSASVIQIQEPDEVSVSSTEANQRTLLGESGLTPVESHSAPPVEPCSTSLAVSDLVSMGPSVCQKPPSPTTTMVETNLAAPTETGSTDCVAHLIERDKPVPPSPMDTKQAFANEKPPTLSSSELGFVVPMEVTKPFETAPPELKKSLTDQASPKHPQRSSYHQSACEPHRAWIENQALNLERNRMAIYQDLVEKFGFSHSYDSVKKFVRKLKKSTPKRYDRLDFPPGEEAQVDYGQGALTVHPRTGKYRRPRLFVMTLKYSRASFRKVVWKSSQETWSRLHEEAFHYFLGCPQYVVLDNLKEGVIKPDIYEPTLNAVYGAVLTHYGVVADPARVRDPDRKGTVEHAIHHTQDTALKGRSFKTIEEQNEWLMHWEHTWARPRVHGRTKRVVSEMFEEESPFLKKLPQKKFDFFKQEIRTVADDGLIQVGNSYYCAYPSDLKSQVIVRIYDKDIEIMDPATMSVIRRHQKATLPGSLSLLDKDRVYNPSRHVENILADAGQIGPQTKAFCQSLLRVDERVGNRQMRGVVSLAKKYHSDLIEKAAIQAVSRGVLSLRVFKRLVEELQPPVDEKKMESHLTQDHDIIRAPSEYAIYWDLHANNEIYHSPLHPQPSTNLT